MTNVARIDAWLAEARANIKPDRVRLLVEATRSGRHRQTVSYLCRNKVDPDTGVTGPCYCILGLATQVAIENGLENVVWRGITGEWPAAVVLAAAVCCCALCVELDPDLRRPHEESTDTELLSDVQEWYGFDIELPSVVDRDTGEIRELAELNDLGYTLPRLGDMIAYTYLGEEVTRVESSKSSGLGG
jgi:hypothetical protein